MSAVYFQISINASPSEVSLNYDRARQRALYSDVTDRQLKANDFRHPLWPSFLQAGNKTTVAAKMTLCPQVVFTINKHTYFSAHFLSHICFAKVCSTSI